MYSYLGSYLRGEENENIYDIFIFISVVSPIAAFQHGFHRSVRRFFVTWNIF